ncbi:MAG: DUF1501 domain-containing protein [Verrucomicrobiales bacterium]
MPGSRCRGGVREAPDKCDPFWLSGGPSHIDMWDPKPDAPREIRGPFGSIPTKLPGVHVCEHLPLTAKLMDKLTLIRSVDCSASNHTPITMQACNPLARRTNDGKDGDGWPSMGAIAAKFRGANAPGMPGFVGLADSWVSDVWGAGAMGHAFEPANGKELAGRLKLSEGVTIDRLGDRRSLLGSLDGLKRRIETSEQIAATDEFTHQAYDVLLSGRAQKAFNLEEESATMRDFYGRDSMGEKALLAQRLVEAGVTFTLVSGAWGYFDHHGDAVRWGALRRTQAPAAQCGPHPARHRDRSGITRVARQHSGVDDGRIRPRAGHQQGCGPGSLAPGHVDGHGGRWFASRTGHRQHRQRRL